MKNIKPIDKKRICIIGKLANAIATANEKIASLKMGIRNRSILSLSLYGEKYLILVSDKKGVTHAVFELSYYDEAGACGYAVSFGRMYEIVRGTIGLTLEKLNLADDNLIHNEIMDTESLKNKYNLKN